VAEHDFKNVVNTASPKYQEARNTLKPELQPIYDQLVADYAMWTTKSFGRGYVAYSVLAGLVRDGWRPSAKKE
jgi:hypothetical protein